LNIKANEATKYLAGDIVAYEKDYFTNRKYTLKQQLVERHVLAVLKWASKRLHENLLDGQGKRALDVGCAYGYTSKVLAGLGYETCSVDISVWGIRQAKGLSGSDFLVCDAQTPMPFKAEPFDLVTCFDVLEHLTQPAKALLGMFEACKGVLVCTTPNKKVEKPVRRLMRDYDKTHINVKAPTAWIECVASNLSPKTLKVEAFYDLALQFGGKLFFKSFSVPTYGLTVRIAARK
jgi:2-polyprenyl-3-methyl-5-hydroxy-6-metoxy-1,4-benzoquinol methylase